MPAEYHQAPHAHVDGEAPPHQEGHRHDHGKGDPPAVNLRREVSSNVGSDSEAEEPVAKLEAVAGQRRKALHSEDGHVPVDQRVRRLEATVRVAHVKGLVKEEEGQRRDYAAYGGADRLAEEH